MTSIEPAASMRYEASVINTANSTLAMVRAGGGKRLYVRGDASGFAGPAESDGDGWLFALTTENAAELRRRLPG